LPSCADLIASLDPLPPIADITIREMFEAMRHDKKMILCSPYHPDA
jgi:hypothetical protein